MRSVPDRAHDLEALLGEEGEAGPVVLGHARHDGQVAEPARLRGQLLEKRITDTTPVVHRVDVDQALDHVEAALLPWKQASPADHTGLVGRDQQDRSLAMHLPPGLRLFGGEWLGVDGGEGLVYRPVVNADDRLQVVRSRRADRVALRGFQGLRLGHCDHYACRP